MDYLDPKKKRSKRRQLLIMYVLLGIAISIATVVVVYNVNGYSIDRKTGEVVQNGLLYIDTKPESAEITLNGVKQRGRTDARLVVAEGSYDIQLERDGYELWRRNIILEGGSLRRLTYARLIPKQIDTETTLTFGTEPVFLTQSIDKRWVVIQLAGTPLNFQVFDTERPQAAPFSLQLDPAFLQNKDGGMWRVVDWSDDHKTFLAEFRRPDGSEFALINREDGTKAKNITALLPQVSISSVELVSRRSDQFYVFSKQLATVQRYNVEDQSLEQVVAGVADYKSYGDDAFVYMTQLGASENKMRAILRVGDKEYVLRELAVSNDYLLDISKLGTAYVVGVGSSSENRVVVFNDPIAAIGRNTSSQIPVPTTVLRVDAPTELRISADSSIIMARGGSTVASHEFEADRSYNFELTDIPSDNSEMQWVDGQHLLYQNTSGALRMLDFDGSNSYVLVSASILPLGAFNRATEELYAVTRPATENAQYTLTRHFLRTRADR